MANFFAWKNIQLFASCLNILHFWHETGILGYKQKLFLGFLIFCHFAHFLGPKKGQKWSQNIFFLILTYVVRLCFLLPKWAQPPLNSQRFNFGSLKREGCFREISKMYRKSHIKKNVKKKSFQNIELFTISSNFLKIMHEPGVFSLGPKMIIFAIFVKNRTEIGPICG